MPVATKTIDVDAFVDLAGIDPVLVRSTYYVAPAAGAKPYALLAQAWRAPARWQSSGS